MTTQAYQRITDRMIALLEQGTVPWHKPWKASTDLPRNLVSQKPYRGVNVFLLLAMNYESPFWLTFRQAYQLGGAVRKGERACPVVFWKRLTIADTEHGDAKTIPLLRLYHVFNLVQCDLPAGRPAALGDATPPAQAMAPSQQTKPEEIVTGMPKRPLVKHGFAQAFYSPREDVVGLPARERFDGTDSYYSTLFHELVHSTGHETRLKRSTIAEKAGFGSDPYCKEELVAEMGAAFLCGYAEIAERTMPNSAAYLKEWLTRLRDDKALIVQAAAQAQKAVDFILGRASGSENGGEGAEP